MNELHQINKIAKKLERWEEDLNPVYNSKIKEFVGRLIRKLESGVQKLGYFLFITHKWETKQERYLNHLMKEWYKIQKMLYEAKPERRKPLYKQIRKMNEICGLLLQKEKKVDKRTLELFRDALYREEQLFEPDAKILKLDEPKNLEILKEDLQPKNNILPKKKIPQINKQADEEKQKEILQPKENLPKLEKPAPHKVEVSKNIEIPKDDPQPKKAPIQPKNEVPKAGILPKKKRKEGKGSNKLLKPIKNLLNHKKKGPPQVDKPKNVELPKEPIQPKDEIPSKVEIPPRINPAEDAEKKNAVQHPNEHVLMTPEEPPKVEVPKNLEIPEEDPKMEAPSKDAEIPPKVNDDEIKKEQNEVIQPAPIKLDPQALFLKALRDRDVNAIKQIIDKGFDEKFLPPLHDLAKAADIGIFELLFPLLAKDINCLNKNIGLLQGETPLHVAARFHRHEIVKLLLNKGADPNIKNKSGKLPFHYAAEGGGTMVLELLKPNDIDIKDDQGRTALFHGIHNVNTLQWLLKKGADPNIRDNKGLLPLHCAAWLIQIKAMEFLIPLLKLPDDINVQDDKGRTALSWAAVAHGKDSVDFLLKNKAQMDIADKEGKLPFHYAAREGTVEILELLIPKDINVQDMNGRTALSWAADWPKYDRINWLLAHQADKNIPDKEGRLPFHYAAKNGFTGIKALAPENIDIQDNEGRTALSWAACKEPVVLRYLLELGANLNLTDKKGNLPIHYAAQAKEEGSFNDLYWRYNDINVKGEDERTALSFAAEAGNTQRVKSILQKTDKRCIADKDGNTPLHYAARAGHLEIVQCFINFLKPDEIRCQNKDGKTAFQLALEADKKEVVEYFQNQFPQYMLVPKVKTKLG